jgi:hypothetical protein
MDHEGLVRADVEDREHGSAGHGIGPSHLGEAVDAAAPGPELEDPASARAQAGVRLDPLAHL